MHQTIVFSPTIIKFLEENPVRSEALALLQLIRQDTLVTDTKRVLEKEFFDLIDHSPKAQILRTLWGEIFFTLRFYKAEVTLKARNQDEFQALESETILAQESPWPIIVAAAVPKQLRDQLFRQYRIDACDVRSYLNPQLDSQIRGEEYYSFQPGEQFNFRGWLTKYLVDARRVEIADGYIFRDTAKSDLVYILGMLRKNAEVKILTLDQKFAKTKLRQLQKDFQNLKINWVLIKAKRNLHDRWIETDKFRIDLGRGLGFVDPKTRKVQGQANISVRAKSR